jgi:hypothetical protein
VALRPIPGTDLSYHLLHFDEKGDEITEPDGSSGAETAVQALKDPLAKITDVFILSHGWHGDVAGAKAQYDRWVKMVAQNRPDDPGREVRSLVIGVHWPSLAWVTTPSSRRAAPDC